MQKAYKLEASLGAMKRLSQRNRQTKENTEEDRSSIIEGKMTRVQLR